MKNLSLQLDSSFLAKEDRPATKSELNAVKNLDKDLLDIIARQLRKNGLPPKDALKMAQRAFYCANQDLLNAEAEIKRGERDDSPLRSDSAGNHRMKNRIFLAEGSRGQVHKADEQVVKTFVNFDDKAVEHELSMCNEYTKINKQILPAAYINGRELFMPYIHGSIPMGSEVRDAVKELFNLGLMMGDPCPDNFVKIEGGIVPIDFGLVFRVGGGLCIPQCVKREIVYDYINGGYKFIPASLKEEYLSVMKSIDVSLGEESPVGNFNVKKLMASGWLVLGVNKQPGYGISDMWSTT